MGNPYHDPKTGEFTTKNKAGGGVVGSDGGKTASAGLQGSEQLDAVPTAWPESDFAKLDNSGLSPAQRRQARAVTNVLHARAVAAESKITPAISGVAATVGGEMHGLNHRVKEGPSLYRKVQQEYLDLKKDNPQATMAQAGKKMRDTVRYTAVVPEKGYWQSGNRISSELQKIGAKPVKNPPGIQFGGMYRGRNMTFELNGVEFEVQVHTPQSMRVKELNHPMYQEHRLLAGLQKRKPTAERQKRMNDLSFRMQRNVDRNIPIEKGTPVLLGEKDQHVWFVAKDTSFYGPTLAPREGRRSRAEAANPNRPSSESGTIQWFDKHAAKEKFAVPTEVSA